MECLPSYKDSLYLEHHGVLGMKWGVRRYQNADGSLTPAGKVHYANGVTVKRQGSNFKRIDAAVEKNEFDKNLYVSTNEHDFNEYSVRAPLLPSVDQSSNKKVVSVIDFKTNHDIKVANGKAIANYLLSNYGNDWFISPKDAEMSKRLSATTYTQMYNKLMTDPNARFVNDYGAQGAKKLLYELATPNVSPTKKDHESMLNYFRQKGYDAVMDPEDLFYVNNAKSIFKEPLIILDPDKSISKVGQKYVSTHLLQETARKKGVSGV